MENIAQTAIIRYLGSVASDGSYHQGWQDRRTATPVAPVVVELPVSLPVAVHVGWGDREANSDIAVWTDTDLDGVMMDTSGSWYRPDGAYGHRYETTPPAWAPAFAAAVDAIRAAAARAEAERVEVRVVCDAYRDILRSIEVQHAAHRAQWERDVEAIARRFRRRSVEVGEQTVPGLCVVRSSRGKPLGYAHVWDGRWTGRVSHY